jgi:hypothetical protein
MTTTISRRDSFLHIPDYAHEVNEYRQWKLEGRIARWW